MATNASAVEIDAVTKQYAEVTAVDDVSLEISDGEFLTLLGPSGAGKSTLLHMIAGFTEPTRGEIFIGGEPVTGAPPYERNIGMVFQSMALFPHMTVGENVAFPLKMRRFDPGRIDERVAEMLELVRLPGIADRDVSALSGGQQQRVAIARGLAFEPSLLLLDEPLSSLDKKLREEMRQELLRIHREADVTTVHVTHNQEEALTMADRVAVINEGRVVQHSTTRELYADPATAFVADFIGDTNFLPGELRRDGDACVLTVGGRELTVPDAGSEGEAAVGVRAERIRLGEELDTDVAFDGTVSEVLFKGDTVHYEVAIAGPDARVGVTVLNATNTQLFDRGDELRLGWNAEDTFVYPGVAP